jgi:hypothetical protein
MHISLSSTLLALLALTPSTLAAKAPKNAILLSNVKTLTLRDNAKTSHRRVSAIPQRAFTLSSSNFIYVVQEV